MVIRVIRVIRIFVLLCYRVIRGYSDDMIIKLIGVITVTKGYQGY